MFKDKVDDVICTPRRVFGGIAHDKGCENVFKAMRRSVRKTSENGVVSIGRLYQLFLKSVPNCFPNVIHQGVPSEAFDDFANWSRAQLQSLMHYNLPRDSKMTIPNSIFNAAQPSVLHNSDVQCL